LIEHLLFFVGFLIENLIDAIAMTNISILKYVATIVATIYTFSCF